MTELAYYPRLVWCLVYSAGGRWSELISGRYSSNYFINVMYIDILNIFGEGAYYTCLH